MTWLTPDQMPNPVVPADGEPKRRRVYLQKHDFHKHGFTSDCHDCKAIINCWETRPHTEKCRSRMEECLKTCDDGKDKIMRTKERLDEQMGRMVERRILQEEEKASKRARIGGASSSHQAPTSSAQPIAVEDSHMSDQNKRPHDSHVDTVSKKPRGQGSEMEVSYMERMMQEDFVWQIHNVSDMCEQDSNIVQQALVDMNYYDDNIGGALDSCLVQAGEAEELKRFAKMGVYGYANWQDAYDDPEGVFVNVKWVRVNRGTKHKPQVKCRLVAQELA